MKAKNYSAVDQYVDDDYAATLWVRSFDEWGEITQEYQYYGTVGECLSDICVADYEEANIVDIGTMKTVAYVFG